MDRVVWPTTATFSLHQSRRSDVVCFLDSDNLLTGPLYHADFVRADGAVGVAPLPFAQLDREREAWQPGCVAMLGPDVPCDQETMTGFPICYPTSLFAEFAGHVVAHNTRGWPATATPPTLVDVLKTLPAWSEFSPLGAFLMATRARGGPGGWYIKKQQGHPHVAQAWSWGGFDADAVARWEELLRARGPVEGGVGGCEG